MWAGYTSTGAISPDPPLELPRPQGTQDALFSHNMPHVFEVADRIHIQRLGRRVAVVSPGTTSPSDAVAIMTGAADGSRLPIAR